MEGGGAGSEARAAERVWALGRCGECLFPRSGLAHGGSCLLCRHILLQAKSLDERLRLSLHGYKTGTRKRPVGSAASICTTTFGTCAPSATLMCALTENE